MGLGIALLLAYPLSSGLILPGPLDWWFLAGGVLLLFGGPLAYSLYLQLGKSSIRMAIMTVVAGAIIALALTVAIVAVFFREPAFFRDFLLLEIFLQLWLSRLFKQQQGVFTRKISVCCLPRAR